MVLFKKRSVGPTAKRIVEIVILEDNEEMGNLGGKAFELLPGITSIGRDQFNTVVLNRPDISRKHAIIKMSRNKASFTIADNKSKNGVFIKPGRKIGNKPEPLKPGEIIQLGDTMLQLRIRESEEDHGTVFFEATEQEKRKNG